MGNKRKSVARGEPPQVHLKSKEKYETYEDVLKAIPEIDVALATTFDKSVFRDILAGFKTLIKSLQANHKDAEAKICETLLKWTEAYLRVRNAISTNDDKLRQQFENCVPASISYIVAALQYTPKDLAQYHIQILDLLFKLLEKITESTLNKVANLETELVQFIWRPIDIIGDFNTQMMAFRILAKLLKCLNGRKQLEILKSLQKSNLQESICSAVKVYDYPAGKFEKIARQMLNNYNMNLANNNVLVYSFRCNSVNFGNDVTFYKSQQDDQLWVDLNYSPRSITFKTCYRPNSQTEYINFGFMLYVTKFSLKDENILSAILAAPPEFTENAMQLNDLKVHREVKFKLPDDEFLRLQENQCVLYHYNATSSLDQNTEHQLLTALDTLVNNANAGETTSTNNIVPCTQNAALILAPPQPNHQVSENFQKSFDLLTSNSTELAAKRDTINFKLPSQPNCNNQENSATLPEYDSPKTSRLIDDRAETMKKGVKHPIIELSRSKMDNAIDKNSKSGKIVKPNLRRSRNKKVWTSPPKRKQVNKVKPMIHLAKDNGDPQEAIQEYVENGGILNITNFLRNGNESEAVFNEEQRRIILHNVNRISNDLENSAKRFFRRNERPMVGQTNDPAINRDIFEESDSEAEPGVSYRKFSTLRPKQEKSKPKKKRKSSIRTHYYPKKNSNQMPLDNDNLASTSKAVVKRNLRNKRKITDENSKTTSLNSVSKMPKLENKTGQVGRNFGDDIEIDLTTEIDNDPGINISNNEQTLEAAKDSSNSLATSSSESENDNEKDKEVLEEPQVCRENNELDKMQINDIFLSPIDVITNKHISPTVADPINSTSQSINKNNESTEITSTQNNAANKKDFFDAFSKISPFKNATNDKESLIDCILYRSHSDSESDDESIEGNNLTSFCKTFKTPTKFTVEQTEKKSVTRSTKNSFTSKKQPACKVTTSITTHKVISQDVFLLPSTSGVGKSKMDENVAMDIVDLDNLNETSAFTNMTVTDEDDTNQITKYVDDLDATQHQIVQDVSQLSLALENKLKETLQNSDQGLNTKLKILTKKIIDISECIIKETKAIRLEIKQSQTHIDRILCQLNWHWDAFQKQTERFNNFKENMKQFLESVSKISLEEDISNALVHNLSTTHEDVSEISKNHWKEYVYDFTKHLLENVSRLSTL